MQRISTRHRAGAEMGKIQFTCTEHPGKESLAEMVMKPVVDYVNEKAGKELVKPKEAVKKDELAFIDKKMVKQDKLTKLTKIEKSAI